MLDIKIGDATRLEARVVALEWTAHTVPDDDAEALGLTGIEVPRASGVYALTGRHDTHHSDSVLYIGQGDDIASRMPSSVRDHVCEMNKRTVAGFYSDVWDLTLRWAELSVGLLASVERLLLMSHSPAFNSQLVRRDGPRDDELDLLIFNAGRKGPLLPIVAGWYLTEWKRRRR